MTIKSIQQQALSLPKSERMELMRLLMESLATSDDLHLTALQLKEVQDRLSEYEAGKVTGIPAEQVMQKLYERYSPESSL